MIANQVKAFIKDHNVVKGETILQVTEKSRLKSKIRHGIFVSLSIKGQGGELWLEASSWKNSVDFSKIHTLQIIHPYQVVEALNAMCQSDFS